MHVFFPLTGPPHHCCYCCPVRLPTSSGSAVGPCVGETLIFPLTSWAFLPKNLFAYVVMLSTWSWNERPDMS
ncbi:hypothetical protein I7I48_09525 [Histoplasma ohiense]|nr:hypothetical protein I7I48_09525 [Histoplasma ohiense (nom. inval.)]